MVMKAMRQTRRLHAIIILVAHALKHQQRKRNIKAQTSGTTRRKARRRWAMRRAVCGRVCGVLVGLLVGPHTPTAPAPSSQLQLHILLILHSIPPLPPPVFPFFLHVFLPLFSLQTYNIDFPQENEFCRSNFETFYGEKSGEIFSSPHTPHTPPPHTTAPEISICNVLCVFACACAYL
jgi:hypothetical protein